MISLRSKGQQREVPGFTLLEVLVSVAITAIIIITLVQVFGSTTDAWLQAEGKTDRNRTGRILSEFIARELAAALLPVDAAFTASNPNLQLLINPPLSMVPLEYRNPDCLFWQAPVATETSKGEIAEVGYFVKWQPIGDGAAPSLRRFFINPTVTDPVTKAVKASDDFLIYRETATWLRPALLEKVAPADKASGYAGLVAENVVGLWVRFYGEDGREVPTTAGGNTPTASFDSRRGYDLYPATSPTVAVTRALPVKVAISIAQLDARHAALMGGAWTKVRTLANAAGTTDAGVFMESFQLAAKGDPSLERLLPGLRTYETNVILENAR